MRIRLPFFWRQRGRDIGGVFNFLLLVYSDYEASDSFLDENFGFCSSFFDGEMGV